MRVLNVRNVDEALPYALDLLDRYGYRRDSRNGPVIQLREPVTTVYGCPWERVILWPQRDANPAFHLYESLWMLAGRNDVSPLLRYVKRFIDFSDDGKTLWDAYGYRWRHAFNGMNQLLNIANMLKSNADDRRAVLQMWSPQMDLSRQGRAVPCNLTATFQRGELGELNMVVFCRSNDIILGAYGANAVHFSMLQEYLSVLIGCPMGTYSQVSVNWHAYVGEYERLRSIPRPSEMRSVTGWLNTYDEGLVSTGSAVVPTRLIPIEEFGNVLGAVHRILDFADYNIRFDPQSVWERVFVAVLASHAAWKNVALPVQERYDQAVALLDVEVTRYDWLVAMRGWLDRRYANAQGDIITKPTAVIIGEEAR